MEIISPWFLYFWTRLDLIVDFADFAAVMAGLVMTVSIIVSLIYSTAKHDSDIRIGEAWKQLRKWSIPVFAFFMLTCTFIPNKKDAAIIYIIPKVANSKVLQGEFAEIYQYAKTSFKEYIVPAKVLAKEKSEK